VNDTLRYGLLLLAATFLPGNLPACAAEAAAPAEERIKALISCLNSESFDAREDAVSALRRLGAAALPQVREARKAAGEDAPELQERLDAVISGPRVQERRVAAWLQQLKATSYDERLAALEALETAGVQALPQVEGLLAETDPFLAHAGLWLLARLNKDAQPAMPAVVRRLTARLEALEDRDGAPQKEPESWSVFIHPRGPELGDPPVVDFHLGERDAEPQSYAYDIISRTEGVTFERRRVCLLQPWSNLGDARDAYAHLRGVVLAFGFIHSERTDVMRVHPALELSVLSQTLQRLGASESEKALLKRTHLRIGELLSRETARP